MTQQPQSTSEGISLPHLTEESLVKVQTVTHTIREGGPVLKHEEINNKHIIHNYGLGAAAVPLAYGAATMACRCFAVTYDHHFTAQTAVIGSGVLGLMTALEMVRRGRKVTVYSADIPDMQPSSVSSNRQISSQILPVIWLPTEYDWTEDMLKHQLYSKMSYDFLRQCVDLARYQSIKTVQVYDMVNQCDELKDCVSSYVANDWAKEGTVTYRNGKQEKGTIYKTFYIDSRLLLEELKIQAMLRGVKFIKKQFKSLSQILQLQENYIFNCTNASSSYLFEDTSLVKKHYLLLDFDQVGEQHKADFVYKGGKKEEQFEVQAIGKKNMVVMKIKEGQESRQSIRSKIDQVRKALQEHDLKPRL